MKTLKQRWADDDDWLELLPPDDEDDGKEAFKSCVQVLKFNPHHGTDGRFSTGGISNAGFSALDRKIINYNPNKPLDASGGADLLRISDLLPGSKFVPYSRTPFFDTLMQLQGTTNHGSLTGFEMKQARDELFRRQPVVDVPLRTLTFTQNVVHGPALERARANPEAKPAQAVKHNEQHYLVDGHHRAINEARAGATTVPAHVLDLDKAHKAFIEVLKFNPHHDAQGRFSTADGANFVSIGDKFQTSIDKLRANNITIPLPPEPYRVNPNHIPGWDAAQFRKLTDRVTPQEVFHSLFGEDPRTKAMRVDFEPYDYSKFSFIRDGTAMSVHGSYMDVHGGYVEDYTRTFDFKSNTVDHTYLKYKEGEAGEGAAKNLFRASLQLYDKMGLSKVTVHAALELGAYTWSRYGFRYANDQERGAHTADVERKLHQMLQMEQIARGPGWKMSADEQRDFDNIKKLLHTQDLRVNQMLVDLPTPHLNKWVAKETKEYLRKNSSMMKHLFYETHWHGELPLDRNGPDRKRADAYARSGGKAKKSFMRLLRTAVAWGARQFDNYTQIGYTVLMKTTPENPNLFEGDCSEMVNGRPSNGAAMQDLLGNEPDVSETSLALAERLGLKDVAAALRKGQ